MIVGQYFIKSTLNCLIYSPLGTWLKWINSSKLQPTKNFGENMFLKLYYSCIKYAFKETRINNFLAVLKTSVLFYFNTFYIIYSLNFCRKSADRQLPIKYFLVFHLAGNVWPGDWNVASSRLISQITTRLSYGDFINYFIRFHN